MRGDGASELDGVWRMARAEFAGAAVPEVVAKHTTVELRRGEYQVRFDGETADAGTFELGGRPDAGTMLLRGIAGPNSGRTIPCIFELTGNRLCVCYGLDGVAPTGFATTKAGARYLATYHRNPGKP